MWGGWEKRGLTKIWNCSGVGERSLSVFACSLFYELTTFQPLLFTDSEKERSPLLFWILSSVCISSNLGGCVGKTALSEVPEPQAKAKRDTLNAEIWIT